MVEYAALDGWPVPVRFAVATAVLPLEVIVTGVRVLKDVEVLLAELGTQLRVLRPAVEAVGDAYADGHLPVVDAVDDLVDETAGTRGLGGVVLAPVTAVRDVFFPVSDEAVDREDVVPAAPPAPEFPGRSLFGWARRGSGALFGPFGD